MHLILACVPWVQWLVGRRGDAPVAKSWLHLRYHGGAQPPQHSSVSRQGSAERQRWLCWLGKWLHCVCVCVFSRVWLPWTVAHQASLSVEFFRQEYWSELPFPPPENLPDPGIKHTPAALQADSLLPSRRGSPKRLCCLRFISKKNLSVLHW